MIKEKIEMKQKLNNKGEEVISLFLHSEEFGILWLREVKFKKSIKEFFLPGKSVNELYTYKSSCDKTLNKLIDRLPAYIKYAKNDARNDRITSLADRITKDKDANEERAA